MARDLRRLTARPCSTPCTPNECRGYGNAFQAVLLLADRLRRGQVQPPYEPQTLEEVLRNLDVMERALRATGAVPIIRRRHVGHR